MNPVLTIYIPTARLTVVTLLESLAPQLCDGVEVIVSDNTGHAEQACAGLPVDYQRRRYNIGGDANILRAATCGLGEYLWVIGDDDTLLPDAVSDTLGLIREHQPDRIIHFTPSAPMPLTGWHGILRDLLAGLGSDLSMLIAATLITANVFRRSVLDVPFGLRMIDTHYPLMWAALSAQEYVVADRPAFEVGINPPVDPQRQRLEPEWRELLLGLSVTAGWTAPFDDPAWNFASAARRG